MLEVMGSLRPYLGILLCMCFGFSLVLSKRGYMLTFPEQLQIGAPEKFCLVLYNVSFGVNLKLNISCYGRTADYESLSFHRGSHECFTWTIPDFLTPGSCDFVVKGTDEIEDYTFSDRKEIQVVDTHQITFIQTDKPIYKPGENVKFRILTVTQDLMPLSQSIETVTVQDPHGFYMKEWKDLTVQAGLASLEFKLYERPLLGEWKIEAVVNGRKNQQIFTVDEYVLPKFQVDLKLPKAMTVATESLTFNVCSKYTFGKPLQGSLNASICLQNTQDSWFCHSNIRPCAYYKAEIDGCHQFNIETKTLQLTDRRFSLLCDPVLVLDVNVTEHSTGITVHETQTGPGVMEQRINLKFESQKYFKPFFPYRGKVHVTMPEGRPASGEKVQLTIAKLGIQRTLVSNSEGIIEFTITNLTHGLDYFVMNVKSTDEETVDRKRYTLYAASTKKHVKQWYSPSSSYIEVSTPHKAHLHCGGRLTVKGVYSTLPENVFTKGFVQILSKGNILHTKDITEIVDRSRRHVPRPTGTVFTASLPDTTVSMDSNNNGASSETAQQGPKFAPDGPPGYDKMEIIAPPGAPGTKRIKNVEEEKAPAPISFDRNDISDVPDNRIPELRTFSVHVSVTHEMSPVLRLLVYLITDKGEMVADTVDVHVKHCDRNKVKMHFSDETAMPGDKVSMTISAAPKSICSTTMVDKSVFLHGGSNLLKHADVTNKLKDLDLTSDFINDWLYCSDLSELPPLVSARGPPSRTGAPGSSPFTVKEQAPPTGFLRKKRSIQQFSSNMYDSLLAFKVAGLVALTDLDLQTRPCIHKDDDVLGPPVVPGDPHGPIPGMGGSLEETNLADEPKSTGFVKSHLRKSFPETWLWDLYEIPSTGTLTVNHTMADTVTEWVGNSYCSSPNVGMGVSEVTRITGFQSFFMSVKLPYSVFRGEIVNVDVLVFNYLPHCTAIQVNLVKNGRFTMEEEEEDPFFCICSEESKSHTFRIRPQVLGTLSLTFTAFLREHRVHCKSTRAPPGYAGKRVTDLVVKDLIVQPEGMEIERTSSHYICPSDSADNNLFKMTLSPDLPKDSLVPGSLKGWINVMGDIMGPVLNGLDDLILLPTGCGEQNMVRMAPNIAVLQYLTATRQLSEDTETKALDYLNKGYQQQLKFMHPDGSYSAFGEADDAGSTWLTAFVFKTLRQAMHFIYIDRKQIQTKSWEYLLHQQGEDGCFNEHGKVLGKYMMGGVAGSKEDKKRALTAYVLLSMLESFKMMKERTPPFIALAIKCIEVEDLTDPYTLALVSYAMTLYKPDSKFTTDLLTKLKDTAITDGNMMFWKRDKTPAIISGQGTAASAEIEMTAYALLALLTVNKEVPIKEVIPIVRWLTNQRNAYGGFSSTQDTVVALQALSRFASRIYGDGLDVAVNVATGSGDSLDFRVTGDNSIILQQQPYSAPDSDVHITAKGDGCILLQTTQHYNVLNKVLPNAAFDLNVTTPVTMEIIANNCRSRLIRICARLSDSTWVEWIHQNGRMDVSTRDEFAKYTGPDTASNMVVIEAKVLSGWIPDVASLKRVQANKQIGMKMYEMDKKHPDVVNFYFDQMDSTEVCFEFKIVQEIVIENKQPAMVKVLDYYETELEVTSFYELSECSEEEVEHVDVTLKDKDLYIEDPDEMNEDLTSIYDLMDVGNEAAFSDKKNSKEGPNLPAPKGLPVCPVCNKGKSSMLHNICSKHIWTMEIKGDNLSLRVVSSAGLSPELLIPIPEGMYACDECKDVMVQGKMSLAVLTTVDWKEVGKSFIDSDTQILEWSESLQKHLQTMLASCPNKPIF